MGIIISKRAIIDKFDKYFRKLCRLFPISKSKIIFISQMGKSYSCNPKYICEYLTKNFDKAFDLYWVYDRKVGKPSDLPDSVKALPYYSRKYLYHLSTAGIVISNTRLPKWFYFKKRRGQRYIQTWHSSLRLKCIEGDAKLSDSYISIAKSDSAKIDAIISGCRFSTDIYKRAFWYNGPIWETGTPRIDYLLTFDECKRNSILMKAKLPNDKKILLYAPTFRKGGSLEAYNIDYTYLKNALEIRTNQEWIILVRLHPNLLGITSIEDLPEGCIDVSQYGDMQELLCISDILITDYSSSMFDMAFMKKPCWLYVSDLDNYIKNERNLYFDIETLPFPTVRDNLELLRLVNDFDIEKYKDKLDEFLLSIGSFESGNACENIAKLLFPTKF